MIDIDFIRETINNDDDIEEDDRAYLFALSDETLTWALDERLTDRFWDAIYDCIWYAAHDLLNERDNGSPL